MIPDAPYGWRTSRDIMENFLLAAALEMQARTRVSPARPWAPEAMHALPAAFRYDTLGALLRNGPYMEEDLRQGAFSSDPAMSYAYFTHMHAASERIGRLPLLGVVWEFVDLAVERTGYLRSQGQVGLAQALSQLEGVNLGKHGVALFMAAFYRKFIGDPAPPYLSPIESAFVDAEGPIPGFANGGFGAAYGGGSLAPSGRMYLDSLWTTAWQILTLRAPEHYIHAYADRRDSLMDVLERGARIAASSGTDKCWPGWPA